MAFQSDMKWIKRLELIVCQLSQNPTFLRHMHPLYPQCFLDVITDYTEFQMQIDAIREACSSTGKTYTSTMEYNVMLSLQDCNSKTTAAGCMQKT
jgi:hypothetical protein